MTGSGIAADPYKIYDVNDLQAMEDDLTAYYELANDIDASATSGWNAGAGFVPIGQSAYFTGQLDGKGYTISDLYISRSGTDFQALIGDLGGTGVVQNVEMTGADITGRRYVAALVAYVNGGSCTIHRCSSAGLVEASLRIVGGIIGWAEGGTFSESYSTCTITCGGAHAGGFAGYIEAYVGTPTITDCYAKGSVTATTNHVGGFIGYNEATITDCFSTGAVSGATEVGGFCGDNNGTITNCFWDTETSLQASSDGGTGKTTEEMKAKSTFTDADWDFATIWGIFGYCNDGYPCLRDVTPSCESKVKGNPNIDQRIYQHIERMGR